MMMSIRALVINMEKLKPWWETADVTRAVASRGSIEQIAILSLLSAALKEKLCLYEHSRDGNLLISTEQFIKEIDALDGQVLSRSLDGSGKNSSLETTDHILVWDDAILTISFDDNDYVWIKGSALNKELILKIKEISDRSITQKTQGKAYVFVSGDNGPELRQISGKAGIELERDNYTKEVLADFDHIVKDLQSPDPCAKLVIADGEPGTGKTYLVRGITNAVNGATFVLVPPAMISEIMSPQFIPVLMDHHTHDKKNGVAGPIVFIVEDADSCLVKREGDNMNSISSLLNLGAGIFGDLFDVRVIATTNAKKIEMDPAITRNGRCCRYIETGPLPREQAEKVFSRISGGKKDLPGGKKEYMLADIYYATRQEESEVVAPQKYKVGF